MRTKIYEGKREYEAAYYQGFLFITQVWGNKMNTYKFEVSEDQQKAEFEGKTLVVRDCEVDGLCYGCFFHKEDQCSRFIAKCTPSARKDKRQVIWVGEE